MVWLRQRIGADLRLSNDSTALHHQAHAPERTDVAGWIAVERSEIGEAADLDAADLRVKMQHPGGP